LGSGGGGGDKIMSMVRRSRNKKKPLTFDP
jgi:hypothetical protein